MEKDVDFLQLGKKMPVHEVLCIISVSRKTFCYAFICLLYAGME